MALGNVKINDVTQFILHTIYNRPQKELSPGESRYNMLLTRKKSSKTFPSSKAIPPDQKSLNMKILRSTYVAHCMVNCLNSKYIPLDPSNFGWTLVDDSWKPVWFEGNALPGDEDEFFENENDDSEESGDEAESSDDSDFVDSCDDLSDDDFDF